jgi:hypothetical protein
MHAPMRTCVGCRSIRPQTELLRTVRQHAHVVPALRPVAPVPTDGARAVGRAAYLCPSRSCLSQAVRRGGFARAFQASPVTADVDTLWAALSNEVNRESNLLQRSVAAVGTLPRSARVHQLLTLKAAMLASGRGA